MEAARDTFGTQHGVVLQFQCDPTKLTAKQISSDGVVLFGGYKIDQSRLEQFSKGAFNERTNSSDSFSPDA